MFEILSLLIIYSKGDIEDRLAGKVIDVTYSILVLFDVLCYSEELFMKSDELKFALEKLITSLSSTLSIKRSYLAEIYKFVENKIL
jgi:hypothetical protein